MVETSSNFPPGDLCGPPDPPPRPKPSNLCLLKHEKSCENHEAYVMTVVCSRQRQNARPFRDLWVPLLHSAANDAIGRRAGRLHSRCSSARPPLPLRFSASASTPGRASLRGPEAAEVPVRRGSEPGAGQGLATFAAWCRFAEHLEDSDKGDPSVLKLSVPFLDAS